MTSRIAELLAQENWQQERQALRAILVATELAECVKWNQLCYTYQGANVALVFCTKQYFGIGFLKGALLKDPRGVLTAPGPNTQSARQLRFSHLAEVQQARKQIESFVAAAIRLEQTGAKVSFKQELSYPPELAAALEQDAELRRAFLALTPGRQRSHILHISSAKQEKTRLNRIQKCAEKIYLGKGFNEY